MAKLIAKDPSGSGREYDLSDAVVIAGRASTNPIQILDEKSSRQHFKIERRGAEFFVVDLGSTNGTRVNGVRITIPTRLYPGDSITVGKIRLEFSDSDAAPPGPAPLELPPRHDEIDQGKTLNSTGDTGRRMVRELQAERARVAGNGPANGAAAKAGAALTFEEEGSSEEEVPPSAPDAVPAKGPKYVLKVIEGSAPGSIFEVGDDPVTLGRHASNTIVVDDDVASNFHSEIRRDGSGFVVADLGSTNGTRLKAAGQDDFEKILRAPLRTGSSVRVGKTLLLFENIGTPVPEDEAAPDNGQVPPVKPLVRDAVPESASAVTAPVPGSSLLPKIAALFGIAVIIGLGIWLIPPLLKGSGTAVTVPTDTHKVVRVAENLIPNSGFDEGTDEEGNPKEFVVIKGAPEVNVKVSPDADHLAGDKDSKRLGLQINKGGAKVLLKPTIVETHDPIAIDASKVYEFSGWLRNDEDGIYGLRVVWVNNDRSLADHPLVWKDSQEWKQAPAVLLTPPAWATGARVGVFVQGKNGKAFFDDLVFKEHIGGTPTPLRSAGFNSVNLQFESSSGRFGIESQGKAVIEEATLRVEALEGKAVCDLVSAFKPQLKKDPDSDSVVAEGKLFDFGQQDLVRYEIAARPGAAGVDLALSLKLPADSGSKAVFRFFVLNPLASGAVDLTHADGTVERVQAAEDKAVAACKGALFNAGKAPQFALSLAQPADFTLKHEGRRLLVEIRFQDELKVATAPEDIEQKKLYLAAVSDLNKAIDTHDWAAAETRLKAFREKLADRSPQAADAATKAADALKTAFAASQEEVRRALAAVKDAPSPDSVERARQSIKRAVEAWKGSEHASEFDTALSEIDTVAAQYVNVEAEKKADENLKQAIGYVDKKIYNIAISYLKVKILDDPVASKTQAAEKARALLPSVEAALRKQDDMSAINDKLKNMVKNFIANGRYNEAIKAIESDPEFKANRADLPDIQSLIEDLRKKNHP